MRLSLLLIGILVALASVTSVSAENGEIKLLEPIDGNPVMTVQPGAGTFLEYYRRAADWILTVAVGFCVIWVVIGGIQMMLSGVDSQQRSQGESRIRWAITGLIFMLFAGFFLKTLNSLFYT